MIEIRDKTNCCGCNACGDACHVNAIKYIKDNEGFEYPIVDSTLCVHCGMCNLVCPMEKTILATNIYDNPVCFAAYNKNIEIRSESTSGGVFSALAEYVYNQGGYVCGATFTKEWNVIRILSNSIYDLQRLRGSKYVQSTSIGIYEQIRELLNKDEYVMACGTPCQAAALRGYLRKEYANLLVVEILCKGCNSPKVFNKYIKSLEKKYKSRVISIIERYKKSGWRSLTRKISFLNGITYYGDGKRDSFQKGFQYNLYCRPSCYKCKFRSLPRVGDITLGDLWGVEKIAPSIDDNMGTSLVLLNNDKGHYFFNIIKNEFVLRNIDVKSAIKYNGCAFWGEGMMPPPKLFRKVLFCIISFFPFDIVDKFLFRPYIHVYQNLNKYMRN